MKRKRIKKHGAYDYGYWVRQGNHWLPSNARWINFYPFRPSGKIWYVKEASE